MGCGPLGPLPRRLKHACLYRAGIAASSNMVSWSDGRLTEPGGYLAHRPLSPPKCTAAVWITGTRGPLSAGRHGTVTGFREHGGRELRRFSFEGVAHGYR